MNYSEQCEVGRKAFAALLQEMQAEQNPILFLNAIKRMVADSQITGIEIGFIQAAAERLVSDCAVGA
ncbi:hypothetical protein [Ancylobacter defluvii]|uniref:Uncharacterized protein n=1 Tax=Ancylobacter defluvii TaxID=1282440 RepID=A0A9W6JVH6_9HYPH|nr:hypothetical protein [Ancylobacter defluvii]MBS7589051.1 hypothetical protein [Ancylobacter defluvii]GLK84660.1 hypothetical protein GCM10017653_27300 [Ancylobacter defluvii]